jgi:hypothetical protein
MRTWSQVPVFLLFIGTYRRPRPAHATIAVPRSAGHDEAADPALPAPYAADAKGLWRFLETRVIPWYTARLNELAHRLLSREQAYGKALDPDKLERLGRYEVHLDRKLERTLTMLNFQNEHTLRVREADCESGDQIGSGGSPAGRTRASGLRRGSWRASFVPKLGSTAWRRRLASKSIATFAGRLPASLGWCALIWHIREVRPLSLGRGRTMGL